MDRLTLLALDLGSMKKRGMHVLAFSPNTSLRFRGGAGTVRERALLVHLLRPLWRIGRGDVVVEIFRVRAKASTFESTPLTKSSDRRSTAQSPIASAKQSGGTKASRWISSGCAEFGIDTGGLAAAT